MRPRNATLKRILRELRSKNKRNSLAERLNRLLNLAKKKEVTLKVVMDMLSGKGQAVLLILFSLPFCQPIQIPGFSTPFGIILAFIGLRIAFGHRAWFPKTLLDRKIPYHVLKKIASIAIKITDKLKFLISTRLVWLVQKPILHILHGLTITFLAIFLSLPLPIPFTNLLAAFPLLAFGLGLLEDDGLMIIIGYLLAFLCFFSFVALIWLGKAIL
ncbi:MAG: exopolysaccharide biosynthesis protein [Parachlamydiaceae bacterium]|nr:exopolysaccharide biosynthesis protein [Parachlamydiaceae bacterium]